MHDVWTMDRSIRRAIHARSAEAWRQVAAVLGRIGPVVFDGVIYSGACHRDEVHITRQFTGDDDCKIALRTGFPIARNIFFPNG